MLQDAADVAEVAGTDVVMVGDCDIPAAKVGDAAAAADFFFESLQTIVVEAARPVSTTKVQQIDVRQLRRRGQAMSDQTIADKWPIETLAVERY